MMLNLEALKTHLVIHKSGLLTSHGAEVVDMPL